MEILSGLYYPFSRPIDMSSLKQMLLVFESVTFLDPVDDNAWRAKLFNDLEISDDKAFSSYKNIHENTNLLFQEGALKRVAPKDLTSIQSTITTASTLSDLLDPHWSRVAANPKLFSIPHGNPHNSTLATWQTFLSKMPKSFIESIQTDPRFQKHLLVAGDEHYSWKLSYEAGSAVALNVHLSAAEELMLSPITDSRMHHELLLRKTLRQQDYAGERARPINEKIINQLTHSTACALIDELLPKEILEKVSVETILRFREDTLNLRKNALKDISNRLGVLSKVPDTEDLKLASREIQYNINNDLRIYRAEIAAARNKLWPAIIKSTTTTSISTGSLAALAISYVGAPGYILTTSIVAGALSLLKESLDFKIEKKKINASKAPSITYLAQVGQLKN